MCNSCTETVVIAHSHGNRGYCKLARKPWLLHTRTETVVFAHSHGNRSYCTLARKPWLLHTRTETVVIAHSHGNCSYCTLALKPWLLHTRTETVFQFVSLYVAQIVMSYDLSSVVTIEQRTENAHPVLLAIHPCISART